MFLQKAAFFGQNSTLTQSSRVRAVLKAFLVPFLVFVRSKITINKNIKLPPPPFHLGLTKEISYKCRCKFDD